MANTETKWFVEPYGRKQAFTNEVIARQIGNEHACVSMKVLRLGSGNGRYFTNAPVWSVPNYEFITALGGMAGTSFRTFRQVGKGNVEQVDFAALKRQKKQRIANEKIHFAS